MIKYCFNWTFFRKFFNVSKGPSSFLIFCNRMYVNKSQMVRPFTFLLHEAVSSERKNLKFFQEKCFFFCFPLGKKWFPILIEHERHPLCVSKLFSELVINTSWAYFKNFLSLRYSADFRRSRFVFSHSRNQYILLHSLSLCCKVTQAHGAHIFQSSYNLSF